MGRKTHIGIITLLLLIFLQEVNAQVAFSTVKGKIKITSIWNDSALIAVSNELIVLLDYETACFEMRLDKSTLRTGVDSLDKRLEQLRGDLLIYEGKLGLDYVRTHSHPPQDFEVEGHLICAPHTEAIIGKGRLEYTLGDVYSCLLTMTFHLNLEDVNIDIDLSGLHNEVHVEVIQIVLKRNNE